MALKKLRTALVGAGYIAPWHLSAIRATEGVEVTAVCDRAKSAADALAAACGAQAFTKLDQMLEEQVCDVVHILTPPDLHHNLAIRSLEAGVHVFAEKPFTVSAAQARDVVATAAVAGRRVGVNHNFLGLPSYARLKAALEDGRIGPVDSADIVWRYPLQALRAGPYGLWMLRETGNLLIELGPHLFAFAVDLFGPITDLDLRLSKPISLPNKVDHFQSWDIRARAGNVDLSLRLSLAEGLDDRSVSIRGVTGHAHLDYARDTFTITGPSAADIVLGPFKEQLNVARQYVREGSVNALRQLLSLNAESPYALGFRGAIGSFYDSIQRDCAPDARFSGESALAVANAIESTLCQVPVRSSPTSHDRSSVEHTTKPSALVIGGTGFIGRYLTRALVAEGYTVRVLSRGQSNIFHDIYEKVEFFPAALDSLDQIAASMAGIDVVYHLAKAEESTWEGYLKNDVAVTERVAEAALNAKVKRFVYTGTIASYDSSVSSRIINEETGFRQDMSDRNLYARSKALCEARLIEMHQKRGLPLAIARPGIVLGKGGPLQHWGIGRWNGAGAVMIWGNGRNILPFVLVEDVAEALVKMGKIAGLEGQSFNLIGEPMLSAYEYFHSIEKILGARIKVTKSHPPQLYVSDLIKFILKRFVTGHRNIPRPSLRDWRSRAHLSQFSNYHAKSTLGWTPESDFNRFLQRAIGESNLFGF
jgi:predicted dehydrogenase/nucleoside-diphosphate-sugar epimerase